MTPTQFFNKVAGESNYMDPETVKEIYYAILRTIRDELRDSGEIRLVDFGTFRLHDSKERNMHNVGNGKQFTVPARKIVKFRPSTRLKCYIRDKL